MLLTPMKVKAECQPTPITEFTPTGIKGCTIYGEGLASWWGGPGVARNDCVWPFRGCQTILITSLETGRSLVVTPTMYGDLYTGTSSERIVDLDPSALNALGLDPSKGLYRVRVEPLSDLSGPQSEQEVRSQSAMPDTAMEAR